MEGVYKIIYVAPERLFTPLFRNLRRGEHQHECVWTRLLRVSIGAGFPPWVSGYRPLSGNAARRPVVGAFTTTATGEVREGYRCACWASRTL